MNYLERRQRWYKQTDAAYETKVVLFIIKQPIIYLYYINKNIII